MLEDRSCTAHTYDKTLAKEVYRRLPAYLPLPYALSTLGIVRLYAIGRSGDVDDA